MGMAEHIFFVGAAKADQRRAGMVADSLWRLPLGDDPIAAQKAVCDAIARMLENSRRSASALLALQSLDRRAQDLSQQLLERYVEGTIQMRSFERRVWVSAMRLSHVFVQAYEYFLHDLRETADVYGVAHARSVVVALFHHRRIELLLRSMRYKKRLPEPWRILHDTYRYAQTRGMARSNVGTVLDDPQGMSTTAEQAYIRLLLADLMNNGQFSPRELLWADGWLGRWCRDLRLQSRRPQEAVDLATKGFAVDPEGTDGLKRVDNVATHVPLFLDPSTLPAMIDEELHLLQEANPMGDPAKSADAALQVALLTKLKTTFDPAPVLVVRRGERSPVAVNIQAIVGLANIVQVLREEAVTRGKAPPDVEHQAGENAVLPAGMTTALAATDSGRIASPASASLADDPGATPVGWQLRDRSDSGCRIRGKIHDLHRVIPGSLIAIRDDDNSPWILSVVRRLRRLMVDYVELGVEHLGRRPRFVKLVVERNGYAPTAPMANSAQRCFAALYLPPSEQHPTMPIKTLLLPARDFRTDSDASLLSSNAIYALRLNDPIQQHSEFVWTSFTVIDKANTARTVSP